jgi:aminoglycoside phosphotransferase (APT) family kinase protein
MVALDRLEAWLDENLPRGKGAPLDVRPLAGGSQNAVFEVVRDDLHAVLRMPPPHAPAARDKGILREWQVISALGSTDVPHTPALGLCADPGVLGRPFYLMGFIDGWSPLNHTDGWPAPYEKAGAARHELAYQLVEGVASLGNVEWQAVGLEDFGRPDGFHERQVKRWSSYLDSVQGRKPPGFEVAAAWLDEHRPLDYHPGVMHGDYSYANVMFRNDAPARLAAIIDWEMATIGDPKLDLAWALHAWPVSTVHDADAENRLTAEMPARARLLEHYAEASGRQIDDFDYYLVLAKWKLAIVLEQGFQRAGGDEKLQTFGPMVLDLFAEAAEVAETTTYRG